jgi:hypothetical protein
MRDILRTEEHVPVPPVVMQDPFYRMTYLIKEEIRKFKWTEGEKGRGLSWDEARDEWLRNHHEKFVDFLKETLHVEDTY